MTGNLQKILAAIFALFVLACLVLLVSVPLFNSLEAKKVEIAALEETLARYQATLTRAKTLKEAGNGNLNLNEFLLNGRATSLGIAEIQGTFNSISRDLGIAGGSFRPLPEKRVGTLKKVGFRINFQTDTYHLMKLFDAAGAIRPVMVFENIHLKAPRDQAGGSDPVLNIQMDVYGLQEVSDG